jgi:ABC-type branched-subunit amino acid transport system ATPase component
MRLYENSHGFYLWIFWMVTFLSVIVFAMLVSTFTAKTTRAILIGLLLFFIGVFLTIAINYDTGDGGLIALISLHPVAAFSYGLQEIGNLEDQAVGLTSNTIDTTDNPSGFTFVKAIRYLIFDCVLWGLVTFYLNRVIPPDYGQAQSLWFPCAAVYNCIFRKSKHVNIEKEQEEPIDESVPNEPVGDVLRSQAKEGKNIEIHGLRKVFGDKTAVDGLNLAMYNGQITCLLGHNGAGKTTTIAMLTGALAPTEGHATVAGKDIRTQMSAIRQDIGICLQHDCLFPQLTVREHIQFFSRLKGLYRKCTWEEAEGHVDQVVQDVALSEKRNTYSKNLSGGMKRKLSVAIAFCGGSEVVLLDEPTSGMVRPFVVL